MENDRYLIMSTIADGQSHTYKEILWFYNRLVKKDEKNFEKAFKRMLEYNWIRREFKSGYYKIDSYQIANKGDRAFRDEAIRRGGNANYYKSSEARGLAH